MDSESKGVPQVPQSVIELIIIDIESLHQVCSMHVKCLVLFTVEKHVLTSNVLPPKCMSFV